MRVFFVTSESTMDHSFTMIRELRKHITLDAVITAKKLTPELEAYCNTQNVKFFKRKNFKNPLSIFSEIKLLLYIRRQKPDLVWFNVLSLYQSILVKLFLKKVLVNAHDIELHPEEKDIHGILSQKITFRLYKNSLAVMSEAQGKQFEKKYRKKPHILQLPVIDYYTSVSRETPIVNEKAFSAESRINFFFFGSIMPYKGIEKLLDAAQIIEDKGINTQIKIYGKLKYNYEALLEKIKNIKNINFTDEFIDYREVCGIYDSNDVIIIPYIQVSQCGPLLIGYSRNVPVICSDLEGFREYVEEGKSGLFFDNTAAGLAGKMEQLISNPVVLNEMRQYIKTEIHRRFSMQALCREYIGVFKLAAA
jgi:glycosyltransferase involved in cell wall biosynthesis